MRRRVQSRPALEVQQVFKRAFGYRAAFWTAAPATVELLGHYLEPNEGLALTAAVARFVEVAAAPRNDGKIELANAADRRHESFWLSDLSFNSETAWANPIKAVLQELRRHGVPFRGFNAVVHQGVPTGLGLGESAALQAATAQIVRKLYPYKLTETGCLNRPPARDRYGQVPPPTAAERLALARLIRRAGDLLPADEAEAAAYYTTFAGQAFHALTVDCRHAIAQPVPMIGQAVLVLCPSGLSSGTDIAAVRNRRATCAAAAKVLHAKSLRSVDSPFLAANRMRLSAEEYRCAYHIVGETTRVVYAERALREDDFLQLGQYLWQSHESARDFFQVSCPELDLLIELARAQPGCLGARLIGEGFGGATVNLVTWNHYEGFIKTMAMQYERQTGRRIQPFAVQVVDGAD